LRANRTAAQRRSAGPGTAIKMALQFKLGVAQPGSEAAVADGGLASGSSRATSPRFVAGGFANIHRPAETRAHGSTRAQAHMHQTIGAGAAIARRSGPSCWPWVQKASGGQIGRNGATTRLLPFVEHDRCRGPPLHQHPGGCS